MSRARFAGAIAGLGLLIAGCGGSSATHDFVAKASSICAATNRALGALATAAKPGVRTGTAGLADLVAKEVPIDQAELRKLGKVQAPAAQHSAYADALAQARHDVALLVKVLAALRSNNRTQLNLITQESSAVSAIAVAGMKRLGLPRCARNL